MMVGKLQRMVDQLRREVKTLRAENGQLRAENERLRAELERAYERIAELERIAARQAAPFRREERDKIPPEQKKRPGRKPGHPGACRRRPAKIDCEIEVPLKACPRCGGPVSDCVPRCSKANWATR